MNNVIELATATISSFLDVQAQLLVQLERLQPAVPKCSECGDNRTDLSLYCSPCLNSDGWYQLSTDEASRIESAQPVVPEDWRPIETAPKDGTPVLLGWYVTWPKLEWVTESAAAGNADIARRGTGYLHGYATHWIPLPKPPVISAGKEVSDGNVHRDFC
jgi:hypothetical protein